MNRKLVLFALVCAVVAVPLFSASYVVPPDDAFIAKSGTVVVARALGSYCIQTPEHDIETVTEFEVSETAKGFAGEIVRVHTPGGTFGGQTKMIGGTPSFVTGSEYLLFLRVRADHEAVLTDFGLGVFEFTDDLTRRYVARAGEVFGWDVDGQPHRELRRDAAAFLAYIRAVARGESVTVNYVVPAPTTQSEPVFPFHSTYSQFRGKTEAAFTGTSYTSFCDQITGAGCTWAGFSPSIQWNQGNSETGAPGTPPGKSAITSSFASWNSTGVGISYVWSTNTSNPKGILDGIDNVNNIVFEKDLTSVGAAPYNCSTGGVLGLGGIQNATGTHTNNGETYDSTKEGDVSMNQGLAACGYPATGNFISAVAHEVGHTLGIRHADRTRNSSAACTTDPSLNCATSAIMTANVTPGLAGVLTSWDSLAAQTSNGTPPCTAASISVQPAGTSISSGQSTSLSVTAAGTAPLSYQWYVGASGDTSSPIGGATGTSVNVSPTTTTSYWVKVTNSCNVSGANSNAATVTVTVCSPPQVTTQPTGSTITFGNSAQLSVVASGSPTLTYQWYVGAKGNTSSPVFNGTTATINVNPQSTTSYWVRVSGACAPPADSNAATVTVNCLAPQVSATPVSRTITQGSSTIFSAIATGGPNMTFQWYQGIAPDTSTPVAGQTGSSITVSPSASTSYWVQATVPGCGTANSNTVVVTVNPNNGCPPVTVTTPTVTQNGVTYTLSTSASSTAPGPVTITWYQQTNSGQTAIGTGTSISVSPTVTTTYLAQAQNSCGSTNGATVTVTIGQTCTPPTVTQPADQVITSGALTTITVVASGSGTLHYQWYRGSAGDTSVSVGTDSPTLVTPSLTATSNFWVKVTNDCSASTNSATVTIAVVQGRHRAVQH